MGIHKSSNRHIQKLRVIYQRLVVGDRNLWVAGIKDVTEDVRIKQKILDQNEELKILHDTLNDVENSNKFSVQYVDNEGRYYWSSSIYDILEREPRDDDEYNNIVMDACDDETVELIMSKVNRLGPNELLGNHEIEITTENGKTKYLLINIKNVHNSKGELVQKSCYVRDITEEYLMRESLIKANEEKTILMKDSHHRIKNNLNLLLRFISLEEKFSDDYEEILNVTKKRISSFVVFHENLYKISNFKEMNISEYFDKFAKASESFYKHDYESFNLKFICYDDFKLSNDELVPLTLIINELVINTLKYAFAGFSKDYSKNIGLTATRKDDCAEFHYFDNGTGLASNFDPEKSTGLGWVIIRSLVSQLNGSYEVYSDNGMHFKIRFPLSD